METICEEETGTRLTANPMSGKQLARGSFLDSFNGWRGRAESLQNLETGASGHGMAAPA